MAVEVTAWPDIVGGAVASLIGLGVLLAYTTDFWENLASSGKIVKRIEVLPEDLVNELTDVVVEMRQLARTGGVYSKKIADWAKRISEAIDNEE